MNRRPHDVEPPEAGPITVLFVHGPPTFGGDSVVVFRTIEHLSDQFRPVLVVPPGSAAWRRFSALGRQQSWRLVPLDLGVVDHLETNRPATDARSGLAARLCTALLLMRGFVQLLRLAIRERAEVVYTLDRSRAVPIATLVARLLRRGLVFHAQSSWTGWKRAALVSDRVIAISDYVRREYERNGIPAEKIDVVHNGIDVDYFAGGDPAEARHRLGLTPDTPLVVLPGRLSRYKGQLELIEAMPRILEAFPAAHFVFSGVDTAEVGDLAAGGGPISMQAVLTRRATELGVADRVRFLTSNEQQMANLFSAADVVAVPSWEEPFGLVVIEAMASGAAVVGATTGAIPEIIVSGESGLVVPPRDPQALADAITALLADRELRQQLASAGQSRVRRAFTVERYGREFEDVLRRVMRGRRRAPGG